VVNRQRVGGNDLVLCLALVDQRSNECFCIDEHVHGNLQVGLAGQRSVPWNNDRIVVRELNDSALASDEPGNATTVIQIYERKQVVEMNIASMNNVDYGK